MINVKKTLLIGTALVTVGGFAASAVAETLDVDGVGNFAVAADPNADPAISFSEDGTATVADGVAITGTGTDAVVSDAGSKGTLTFSGSSIVTGDVGIDSGNSIKVINAGVNSKTVVFNGDVAADAVNVTGTGTISFDGTLTGDVTYGEAGKVNLYDDLTGNVDFNGKNGLLVVGDGVTVDGDIDNGGAAEAGTLTFSGDGTVTGAVGASKAIAAINAGVTGKTVTFENDVEALSISVTGTGTIEFEGDVEGDINFAANGEVELADGKSITGDITTSTANTGKLIFLGDGTVTGDIGVSKKLALIEVEGSSAAVTLVSDIVNVTTVNLVDDGEIEFDNADLIFTGNITTETDNDGTLTISDHARINGNVGASAKKLADVDVAAGKVLTLNGQLWSTDVTLGGANSEIEILSGSVVNAAIGGTAASAQIVTNAGTIVGAITLNSGNNIITQTAGSITGAITTLEGNDELTLTGGTVTGAINLGAGANVVEIDGATVTGNLTLGAGNDAMTLTSGKLTGDVALGAGNDALVLSGGRIVGGINFGAGTNTLLVDGVFSTEGALTNDGTVALTVDDGGVLTLNHALTTGAVAHLVDAGGTLKALANFTSTGGLTNNGTILVGEGAILEADNLAGAGGVLTIVVGTDANGDDNSGTVTLATGEAWANLDGSDAANTNTLTLRVGGGRIANGEEFEIMTSGSIAVADVAAGTAITDNSALFNFTVAGGNTTALVATAEMTNTAAVVGSANNVAAVDALMSITDAQYDADANLKAVYDAVSGASAADIAEVVESIAPTVDAGNVAAAVVVNNQTMSLTETRLASLRTGHTGMAAGNVGQGLGVWGQVFGQTGEQDRRGGIDGYDVDSLGVSVGIDTRNLADNATVGLAFSYADTEVDSKNANRTKTEIDTYQVTLYGELKLDSSTWLTGQAAYAHSDNDTIRHNLGGVAGLNARGDFDADTWSLRAELGRDYNMDSGMVLTPSVLANYMYYDPDNYTETGAGGAGLVVDQDSVSIFELGVGLDASWLFQQADGSYLEPELRVGYRYDLIGDEYETTSRFTGGGASFKTEGFDPAQSTFNIGAGLTYYTTDNWELTANYDFEVKEDYDAHSGYLRAAYKF